ncbi:hypothetical protein GH714_007607 [Hevea brasiliensis]|uniref:CCHC-type domain-containing protein n=1 Tax=Hevea brasiliensis TaxID=3981 RepID=A0A6A6NG61_HEVBR|nr:hypothetical protein GH714_007607 [Hevea brasiliensis]
MGKQTVMEEESVKLHLGSLHSVESAPTAIYTPGTQNTSHRGNNVATKQVRFNPVGNMPLHFEERTHVGYDEHVLDALAIIHFRQDPHFEHYDPHGKAFDRNYRQPDPHGRLFDGDHRQPLRYANNEHVDITRKVKLNTPEHDGKLDLNAFIDCGSRANSSFIKCFPCHDKGHIASQCPHRALALEQACKEEHESEYNSSDYEEEVVGPIDYSCDEDELDIDDERVNVVCFVLSTAVDDD